MVAKRGEDAAESGQRPPNALHLTSRGGIAGRARSLGGLVRTALSGKPPALWIALAVNVLLAILYLWSRGGSTTEVRIETAGSAYRAYVDGKLIASSRFEGTGEGGIALGLSGQGAVPSLPKPSGVDSVRVTDPATGEVIFEDGFGGPLEEGWRVQAGEPDVGDGVLPPGPSYTSLAADFAEWGDYVLEVKLRNLTQASIRVRRGATALDLKLWPYQRYDSRLDRIEGGEVVERTAGAPLELNRGQTLRSIAAMLLRPYPLALAIVATIIVVAAGPRLGRPWRGLLLVAPALALGLWYREGVHAFALGRTWEEWPFLAPALLAGAAIIFAYVARPALLERRLQTLGRAIPQVATPLVVVLAAGAFVLLWYLIYIVGEAMPHVPDSVAYIFQAKIFASFRLTADPPPVQESFSIFQPHFLHVVDGRWFSQYSFGHPLFLAIGQLFHAVWLVPPILGAASVFLIYRTGSHLYGATVGILAAVLLLFSPFFQMTASNFMSHNTAAFTILACLFLLVRPTKRRMLSMFVSGVFLGLLFNIRPLTAVAFIPALGSLLGYELLRAGADRTRILREDLAFAAGALLLLLAYFGYNHATTGAFDKSPQVLTFGDTSDWLGFGGRHSVAFGLQNEQVLLSLLVLVANGWPIAIGLFLAAFPFVLGTRNRWDYFFAASALAIAAATVFYKGAGVMHGPRYLYEMMPFLMLLSARGVQRLTSAASDTGDWLARRVLQQPQAAAPGLTHVATFILVAGLIAFSAYGWMLGRHDAWSGIDFVPQEMSMLEGFNSTDGRLLDRAAEMNIENALILVEDCVPWWCYGSVFWTNSPDLDNDVVWARRLGTPDDLILVDRFEGRNLYLADYEAGTITAVTRDQIAEAGE